jgi:hypothetical protein
MSDVKLTKDQISSLMAASKVEDCKMGQKTTVVCLTLPNGFEIVETASCVDPENYNHETGKSMCMKRIEDEVWKLEGYLLQFIQNSTKGKV